MLYHRQLNRIVARWQALIGIAFNPYRPVRSGAPRIGPEISPGTNPGINPPRRPDGADKTEGGALSRQASACSNSPAAETWN
jgi:hypothetical protein